MTKKDRKDKEIEKMLYDAKKELPTTNIEWRKLNMREEKHTKKSWSVLQRVAASIAAILCLGVGGVTVFANMEMDIDPGEYGQWVALRDVRDWNGCQSEMQARGFQLPEAFGEYGFDTYGTTYVVKHGTTYAEAFAKQVYNPISIQYDDNDWENKDGHTLNIHVGTLEEEYWHGYFSYEKVDGVWVASKAETSFEYEGYTIYGYESEIESRKQMRWRWIDEKNGIGWSVSVPIETGMDNELDSMEVVKAIIELNK